MCVGGYSYTFGLGLERMFPASKTLYQQPTSHAWIFAGPVRLLTGSSPFSACRQGAHGRKHSVPKPVAGGWIGPLPQSVIPLRRDETGRLPRQPAALGLLIIHEPKLPRQRWPSHNKRASGVERKQGGLGRRQTPSPKAIRKRDESWSER